MQVRQNVQAVSEWLVRVITQPRSELNRWQRAVRFAYDLGRHGGEQLRRDRAPQMAAALAYRTLFSLLPILIVGTMLLRAFRGESQFLAYLEAAMIDAGFDSIVLEGTGAAGEVTTLIDWLLPIAQQAASSSLDAIRWVGVLVLVYAAISFMVTIENSFNSVFGVNEGRSWIKRVPMYWFVLTVGPIVVGVTLWLATSFDDWVNALSTWGWVLAVSNQLTSFLTTYLFLLALYMLVPNADVKLRPAMIGAFVAALAVTIVTRFLGAYVSNAVSLTQLSGSLGFIPIFMFSVYIFWVVVLFGLEVAVILQMLPGRTLKELQSRRAAAGIVDPALVLSVMEVLTDRFESGKATSAREAAEALTIPENTARLMLDAAVSSGFVHKLGDGEGRGYVLARPASQIDASAVIELGFSLADGGLSRPMSGLLARFREAQRQTAAGTTLERLLST
ncbi:MAG: YihY/virulence factor BrkB family protein [Planctomycetota bacterium]